MDETNIGVRVLNLYFQPFQNVVVSISLISNKLKKGARRIFIESINDADRKDVATHR